MLFFGFPTRCKPSQCTCRLVKLHAHAVCSPSTDACHVLWLACLASTETEERSRSPQARACPGMPGSNSASPASRARCSDTHTHVRPGAANGAMLASIRQ